MKNATADEAAFPHPGVSGGMTMRQFFAAQAMQALAGEMLHEVQSPNEIAVKAYELADAMLRAQEVKP